ncbi:hypothetical protein ACFQ7B_33675 [Streptomyces erythrochromogenes]|uniref:hypothetical protein n=1 Tax=Streptomyces erythrochromogenes TaxID=285574 RepID=UPI0036BA6CC0
MERRRWDIDQRFTGIASGQALAPGVKRLAEVLDREGWVTEDPEAHLLHHLKRICDEPGSRWHLRDARLQEDGVYEVDVEPPAGLQAAELSIRDAIMLLAPVAEASFAARQVDRSTIECVTGMLDGDGDYAAHGHLIRLRIQN